MRHIRRFLIAEPATGTTQGIIPIVKAVVVQQLERMDFMLCKKAFILPLSPTSNRDFL